MLHYNSFHVIETLPVLKMWERLQTRVGQLRSLRITMARDKSSIHVKTKKFYVGGVD
jgi:hypothetical protein